MPAKISVLLSLLLFAEPASSILTLPCPLRSLSRCSFIDTVLRLMRLPGSQHFVSFLKLEFNKSVGWQFLQYVSTALKATWPMEREENAYDFHINRFYCG